MVDLTVAMMKPAAFACVVILILSLASAVSAAGTLPEITSPQSDDVLRGQVSIIAHTAIEDFATAEISFAYDSADNPAWFPIATMNTPIENGEIAVWDTTTISDGDYRLRLLVTRTDGTSAEVMVDHLYVRNYSPIGTTIPQQTTQELASDPGLANPQPSATPQLALPTPVTLPANPAAVTPLAVRWVLFVGGALGGLSLLLLAIYRAARHMLSR
jgi:hypothetical protein